MHNSNTSLTMLCAQADTVVVDSEFTLQNVDASGGTPTQLFVYGSDQRIYLQSTLNDPKPLVIEFAQPPQSGQPLQLNYLDPQDSSQQWTYNMNNPTFVNVGAHGGNWAINDVGGNGAVGDSIAIYPADPSNTAFSWAFAIP